MGKPLKVVVVGDAHTSALGVAADLENGGFDPAMFLAAGEADLERIAPGCDLVVACTDATGVPPLRVLEMAAALALPPVLVRGDAVDVDEVVAFVRAGARDCVRRGDVGRLKAAVERERAEAATHPAMPSRISRGHSAYKPDFATPKGLLPAIHYPAPRALPHP